MDDDDIIQEFRNGNEKLLNYFKRDRLKQLIDYITVMPEEDDHRKGHKFPFLVNEIFSLDSKLNEKFFEIEVEPEVKPAKAEVEETSFDDESHEHTDENTKSSDSSDEEDEKKEKSE